MDSTNYIKDATRTESKDFQPIGQRAAEPGNIRLLHAALGLVTEAGEFADVLKKHLFYGKPIDRVNLGEEVGDIFWYCAIACDELGINFEQLMEKNINKLRTRFPQKFTEEHAINRNLENERKVLEQ